MAIVSFHHDNLDEVKADFITPPQIRHEAPYNGARTGTIIGAAGELIELIETKA